MNKNLTTSTRIMQEILAEMSRLSFWGRLDILRFVWCLRYRRQHKALNICLSLVVLALLMYLLTACSAAFPMDLTQFVITPTAEPTKTQQGNSDVTLPTATPETCTVQTGVPSGYLNLRTGAGTQYPVVRVLDEGEALTVLAGGAWLAVLDTRGNKGYVNSRYCK